MKEIVSEICNNCTFCFKKACPRGTWYKPAFNTRTLPPFGEGTECPMLQFDAKKMSKRNSFVRSNITVDDTWDICAKCKYATVTNEGVSIGDAFMKYCMDCPARDVRDNLQESGAEAVCS